jgi:hypothetical protein
MSNLKITLATETKAFSAPILDNTKITNDPYARPTANLINKKAVNGIFKRPITYNTGSR